MSDEKKNNNAIGEVMNMVLVGSFQAPQFLDLRFSNRKNGKIEKILRINMFPKIELMENDRP